MGGDDGDNVVGAKVEVYEMAWQSSAELDASAWVATSMMACHGWVGKGGSDDAGGLTSLVVVLGVGGLAKSSYDQIEKRAWVAGTRVRFQGMGVDSDDMNEKAVELGSCAQSQVWSHNVDVPSLIRSEPGGLLRSESGVVQNVLMYQARALRLVVRPSSCKAQCGGHWNCDSGGGGCPHMWTDET
eukprot:scaffold224645_cov17-Tisochrysis_lutea.AAC.1